MTTIIGFFTINGVPATGLTPLPTIRARNASTGALIVTDLDTAEVGDGGYSYALATTDGVDYSIRMDGGAALSDTERYLYGSVSGRVAKTLDTSVDEIRQYHGLESGISSVHTPTSITAGGIAQIVTVVGSTVTKSRS